MPDRIPPSRRPQPPPAQPMFVPPPRQPVSTQPVIWPYLAAGGGISLILLTCCAGFMLPLVNGARESARRIQERQVEQERQEKRDREKARIKRALDTLPRHDSDPPPKRPDRAKPPRKSQQPIREQPRPPVPVPPPPTVPPPHTSDLALAALQGDDKARKQQAFAWLRGAEVDEAKRGAVALELMKTLREPDHRDASLRALRRWSAPVIVEPLLAEAKISEARTRHTIMSILEPLQDSRAIDFYAERVLVPEDRGKAFAALGNSGPEGIPHVLTHFCSHDFFMRTDARRIVSAANIPQNVIAKQCVADLADENDSRQTMALDWFHTAEVKEKYRSAVARAIDPLLTDSSMDIRRRAFRTIERWATNDNVPTLISVVQEEPRSFQTQSLKILAEVNDPRSYELFAAGLNDFSARKHCVAGLLKFGSAAEPSVLPYLRHTERGTRVAACQVLAKIGTSKSRAALTRAANDPDRQVAAAAIQALRELHGR